MAGENTRMISVTVDDDVLANLDEFAKTLGLSRSATVNMLLKASLTQDMGEMFREMFRAAVSERGGKEKTRRGAMVGNRA